ncbi:hypothetical protein BB021_17370 [Elizabethkingia ursingii]|uniref:Uncharacterized protein n=1 Tax=Elizabethkingia ursingii TaxID=1756150 RepID=A0ABX3ND31_9FLAO|nr:hypothetical protein BB021_17370 [Elizabethkingia ursingii]
MQFKITFKRQIKYIAAPLLAIFVYLVMGAIDNLLKFLEHHFSEDMIEYSEEMFPVISKEFPFIFKKK